MRTVIAILFLVFLGGCAVGPHRLEATPCSIGPPQASRDGLVWERDTGPCSKAWAIRYAGVPGPDGRPGLGSHAINYVEIDEQGVLRNRHAAEDALAFAQQPGQGGKQVYMVVFIHGWHHNAEPDDDNVQDFHDALANVSKWHQDKEVRGIYIGWRGKAWRWPLVRYLTFWDRKSTSEEVGRGGLLEFLLRLERAVKNGTVVQAPPGAPADDAAKVAKRDNRLVLVGHSFGASVAFNALAHVFLERFLAGVHAHDVVGPRFRGYGDLVVLVNPAIEAMRYMPFQSALHYYTSPEAPVRADFSDETVPRLVVLSSNGDWATHYAFPFARFFSTVTETHERVSPLRSPDHQGEYAEHEMDGATIGNFKRFHTHAALRFEAGAPTVAPGRTDNARTVIEQCGAVSGRRVRELLSAAPAGQVQVERSFPDSQLRLDPRPGAAYMPYVLAAADTAVIADHTAIGQPHLVCWINQLADVAADAGPSPR